MSPTITQEQVAARIVDALEDLGADREALAPDVPFEVIDVDSLDLVELAQIVEDEYGVCIKSEDMPKLRTLRDAVTLVVERAA